MRLSRSCWYVLLSSALIACGGAPAPASPADDGANAAPAADATTEPSPTPKVAEPAPAALAADSAPAEPAADGVAKGAAESDTARNVKYAVSPDGMRVEVDGVSFVPKAELVKSGAGYAIKLRVEARAKDGNAHSLLAPTGTELAIAGQIKRSGQAEPEVLSDRREGDREIVLKDKPATLTRTWPGADGPKVLAVGDEAELLVGIWGLGADKNSRRPLKKLCKLTVKFDKGKPRVAVGPPDGIGR